MCPGNGGAGGRLSLGSAVAATVVSGLSGLLGLRGGRGGRGRGNVGEVDSAVAHASGRGILLLLLLGEAHSGSVVLGGRRLSLAAGASARLQDRSWFLRASSLLRRLRGRGRGRLRGRGRGRLRGRGRGRLWSFDKHPLVEVLVRIVRVLVGGRSAAEQLVELSLAAGDGVGDVVEARRFDDVEIFVDSCLIIDDLLSELGWLGPSAF